MLRTVEKIAFFSIERVWFLPVLEKVKSRSCVLRYLRVEQLSEEEKKRADKAYTIWTNLISDEKELLSCMRKQVRYEIRRALKENIQIDVWDSAEEDISQVLHEFYKVYLNFCKVSGYETIMKDFNVKRILSYAFYACVIVTAAKFENGAVYHLYVHDENVALLMYSASDFRNENVDSYLAGRANKLLHYKDMLFFKKRGLKIYDWGNVSSFENPNGIDNFKNSFGGEKKILYNVYIPNNIMGKMLIAVKNRK